MDATSPHRTGGRRALLSLLAAAVLLGQILLGTVSPASACACGAFIDPVGQRTQSNVLGETAVLSLREGTQTMVMGLQLDASRTGSTLLMPTPSVPEVSDAESGTLREIAAATAPRKEVDYDLFGPNPFRGAGAGDAGSPGEGGVTVHEQTRIGSYEVAVLDGGADGVRTWLAENGYEISPEVAPLVDPYAEEGWSFTAVRFAPDAVLDGDLEPLRFDFATDELVYPMRFSQAAQTEQSVRLFILSDEPVQRTDPFHAGQDSTRPWIGDPTRYGWVWSDATLRELTGEDLPAASNGGSSEGEHSVVTEFDIRGEPELFTTDLTFGADPEAESVIPTYTVTQVVTVAGIPVGYLLVLAGIITAIAVLVAVWALVRLRSQRRRGSPAAPR